MGNQWKPSGYPLETYWKPILPIGYLLVTYWKPIGNLLGTHLPRDYPLETYWKPIDILNSAAT